MSAGYRELVRQNRAFRRLWLGDVTSFLGDWFNLVALYAAVQAITGSSIAVAMVMVVKTLPSFLVAPFAGPLVDRYDRRRLLIIMDLIRAGCAVGLVFSHCASSLLGLYGFSFAMVCCTGVSFPSKSAALPMLVAPENIGTANALSGGTWSVMLAVGSALGGVATQYLGITVAFLIDAGTFLVSALWFAGLPALVPAGSRDRARTTITELVRSLRRAPYILAVASLKPMMSLANGALVLIPIYGTVAFGAESGALYVGLLYAARGAGATIGSFLIRVVIGDAPRTLRRWIVAGYVLMAGSLWFLSTAQQLWQAALGFLGAAIGSASIWVFSGTLLQLEADESYHGRIFSFEFGVTTLMLAAGGFAGGWALDRGFTLTEVTQAFAVLALPPALLWLGVVLRHGRRGGERAAVPPDR